MRSRRYRTHSQPTCAPQSGTGETPRDYPKIQWKPSVKAGTWSASPRKGLRRTPTTFLLMPDPRHSKRFLAFDFGAESEGEETLGVPRIRHKKKRCGSSSQPFPW